MAGEHQDIVLLRDERKEKQKNICILKSALMRYVGQENLQLQSGANLLL